MKKLTKTQTRLLMAGLLLVILLVLGCTPKAHAFDIKEVQAGEAKAWLIEDTNLPIITLNITIPDAGSTHDPKGKEGLSYLTAALLTEGSGTMSAERFQKELDYYAIDLSVSAGQDSISVSMELLSEHKDKAFELLGQMLSTPRFDPPDIDRIKAEHLAGLKRSQKRPGYRLSRAFYESAFPEHPYARPLYGTEQSIQSLMRHDFKQFATHHIAKNAMQISVVGDIDAKALETLLLTSFKDIPDEAQHTLTTSDVTIATPDEPVKESLPVPQTFVRIAMPGITRDDDDFYAAFVFNHILGGSGLSSKLGLSLRQDRGLTYSVGSDLAILDHTNWLSIDFSTQNNRAEEGLNATIETINALAAQGITDKDVSEAKRYLTGAFPLKTDSNQERVGYLSSMQFYGLGKDYFEKRNSYIEKVTLQQVQSVAKRLLDTNNTLIILIGGSHE